MARMLLYFWLAAPVGELRSPLLLMIRICPVENIKIRQREIQGPVRFIGMEMLRRILTWKVGIGEENRKRGNIIAITRAKPKHIQAVNGKGA